MGRFLGIGFVALLLGGCGPGVAPTSVPAPQNAVSRKLGNVSTSPGNLVYIAIGFAVSVYSYPGGKFIGGLTGIKNPVALCSDSSGNVWVIESESHRRSKLLKYAHDGSSPIENLYLKARADACSVDPSTGNLAVGTLDSNVAVWADGAASPTLYSTSAFFKEVRTIAYDGDGNLYIRSFVSRESGAWLPKGESTVKQFGVTKLGSYAWDGRHFVIGPANGYTGLLTLYKVHNGSGKVAGKVPFKNCAPNYEPNFSIAGSELAVSCGIDETNSLNYYDYPQGGNPIKSINAGAAGSVAISVAPSAAYRQ